MKNFDWKRLLQQHPIFSTVHKQRIDALLVDGVSEERVYPKDVEIVREGQIGDSIFVIGQGSAEALLEVGEGPPIHLSTMRKDEVFGEMAFFEGRPRAATVRAKEDCTVLEIKGPEFRKLVDDYPNIQFKLLLQMSDRLRHTNERILALALKTVDEKLKLFKDRLDTEQRVVEASLKAEQAVVEASLKAAQSVFDQTKIRTEEVISSADRSRSRLNMSAALAGTFVTVVVGLAGLFGWTQQTKTAQAAKDAKGFAKQVESSAKQVEEYRDQAKKSAEGLETTKKDAEKAIEAVKDLKKNLIEIYRSGFFDALVRGDAYHANESYLQIKTNDGLEEQLEPLLGEMELRVVAKAQPPQSSQEQRRVETFSRILHRAVVDAGDRPREKSHAYYLLLVYAYLTDPEGDSKSLARRQAALTAFEKYLSSASFRGYLKSTSKNDRVTLTTELDERLKNEPGRRGEDARRLSRLAFAPVPHST